MNILERANAPTPKLFKTLRTIGLVLLAVSGSLMAAPIALPVAVVSVAGYIAVAGGVMTAVSQVTVDDAAKKAFDAQKGNREAPINGRRFRDEDD